MLAALLGMIIDIGRLVYPELGLDGGEGTYSRGCALNGWFCWEGNAPLDI